MVIWHLEHVKRLDGGDVEPHYTVDESLGDKDVADGRRAEHRERTSDGGTLEQVYRIEGDGVLGQPEGTRRLELGEGRVHLTSELLEDAMRGGSLSATQDAGDRTRLLEAPSPIILAIVVVSPWRRRQRREADIALRTVLMRLVTPGPLRCSSRQLSS